MELKTFSASKLKVYSSCNRKFYYEYVEKAPVKKHPAAALGTAVHRTIERVYKEHTRPDETFFIMFGEELREVDTDISISEKLAKDGVKMVTQYNYTRRIPDDQEVEFTLPFPNQAHALCQIHGYIDQVYPDMFVDLKTNRNKPLNSVLDNDPQFIIYTWAFEQIYGYKPNASIWHHLRTSEDLYANTDGKLDDTVRIVERILDNELTGVWDRTVGETCRICSFRLPCLGRAD